MVHPLFGSICFMDGVPGWEGKVEFQKFGSFGEWALDPDESEPRGWLRLTIHDSTGEGPYPPQEAAFRYLREHEAEVFDAVLQCLFESYQGYARPYESGCTGWLFRLGGVKPMAAIEAPAGLKAQANFVGVEVSEEHYQGFAYLAFEVDCVWEMEHGMFVVWHKHKKPQCTTTDGLFDLFETDE